MTPVRTDECHALLADEVRDVQHDSFLYEPGEVELPRRAARLVAGEAHRIAQQRRGFALQKDAHRASERRRRPSRFECRIEPPPLGDRDDDVQALPKSEARRAGEECYSTCRTL